MKKKLLCLLLAMTFLFNSIPVYAEEYIIDNEVEELFLPALSVPVAQGFAYLMGTLGVLATSKVVYDNSDALQQWGEKEMEKFKLKCTALNIAGTLVDGWFDKLATGVIDKSSACWSAFKEWLNEVRTPSSSGDMLVKNGLMTVGRTYDIVNDIGNTMGLNSQYTVTPNMEGYLFAMHDATNSRYGIYVAFKYTSSVSSPYRLYQVYNGSPNTWNATWGYNSPYYINDARYDCYQLLYATSISNIPVFEGGTSRDNITKAISMLFTGEYVDPATSEYKLVGGVSDVGKSDIINVGNVSYPLGKDEVYIDFGNVTTGSIAGALGGVYDGTLSWSEVISSTGVNVAEGDKVLDDEGVTDVPAPDLGQLDDYKLDLTNLFPFCLPFDFIDFLSVLSAPAETPCFEYEMPLPANINGGSYTFEIDLSPFDSVASLMRTMETLAFIIGLIFITREKMIRG